MMVMAMKSIMAIMEFTMMMMINDYDDTDVGNGGHDDADAHECSTGNDDDDVKDLSLIHI
eukprot:11431297-Karenia_brevis.AAC.1